MGRSLSERHARWLEEVRKIPSEVAAQEGVFSRAWDEIGFPVIDEAGQELYVKVRNIKSKAFYRVPGGTRSVPWGLHAIREYDPAGEGAPLVWVEGEMDRLAALAGGATYVLSVPDGAKAKAPSDVGPEDDSTYAWLWAQDGKLNQDIARFTRHILAVDADKPGETLRSDLAIRLGRMKCEYVRYPDGCNDLNAVLMRHGPGAVRKCLAEAKPIVPDRLSVFSDIPAAPNPVQYSTGWSDLDNHIRLNIPELLICTGTPNSGKSTFMLSLGANLARVHHLKGAILQFEDSVDRNRESLLCYGRAWERQAHGIRGTAEEWIDEYFRTIPPSESEDEYTLDWIASVIHEAVRRHGCRWVLIDPWNEIEHVWARNLSETQYTKDALRELKKLSRQLQIILMIVTHPTKGAGLAEKSPDQWSLYDVEGSNSWANKADHGVIVWRESPRSTETVINISKCKTFATMGTPGLVTMEYDPRIASFRFLRKWAGAGGGNGAASA